MTFPLIEVELSNDFICHNATISWLLTIKRSESTFMRPFQEELDVSAQKRHGFNLNLERPSRNNHIQDHVVDIRW
jgi:hypothetical protein